MPKRHSLVWIVPLAIGVVCAALAAWNKCRVLAPILEYPALIDLGARQAGDQISHMLSFSNLGNADLIIEDVRTNCSCAGLEAKVDGKFVRIKSLRIKPRQVTEVWIRLAVRGTAVGQAMRTSIDFHCNDPTQPNPQIQVLVSQVTGGLQPAQPRVDFGTLSIGQTAHQTIDILDDAVDSRTVQQVISSRASKVSARLIPYEPGAKNKDERPTGRVIGRIEIIVQTDEPGEIRESIEIIPNGQLAQSSFIAVSGRVLSAVEIAPATLVLPRESIAGPVYEAICIVRTTSEKLLDVEVESTPPGIKTYVLSDIRSSVKRIKVVWEEKAMTDASATRSVRRVIRLRARVDECNQIIELPIFLHPNESTP